MLPFLNLGPLGLPTAPLVYILGVWLALYVVDRATRRLVLDPEHYYGLATVALLSGFIGARLAFVLLRWSSFDDNLLGIVWPLTSGYNAVGGIIIAIAAAFFYARWRRLPLWPALDVLAPGLIVFLITVSLADLLGGPGYGTLTDLPWGLTQYGVRRHPVQVYEIMVGLLALGVWWWATMPRYRDMAGRPALLALAVYAGGRLFVEAYRDNAWLALDGIRVVQAISLAALLVALVLLARKSLRSPAVQAGE
jgi:phosphatidylglycerol:prolipoprotein diacylglycerol transferase